MASPIVTWLWTLISGAVGGNIGGALIKDQSLGPIANAILGLIGGLVAVNYSERLADCNLLARLATSGPPELSERCCQLSSAF